MKICISIFALIFSLLFVESAYADWSEWKEYDIIMDGDRPFITLELRTKYSKNWNPQVQWRATNHSSKTLYCASLGERRYKLSSGKTINRGPEGCRTIEPRETEKYGADTMPGAGVKVNEVWMGSFLLEHTKGGKSTTYTLTKKWSEKESIIN